MDEKLLELYTEIKRYEKEPCGIIPQEYRTMIKQACIIYRQHVLKSKNISCALCGKKQIIKNIYKYLKGRGLVSV